MGRQSIDWARRRRLLFYAGAGGSNPYVPSDTDGLRLALDYRSGVIESGGLVSQWTDLSGNDNHFTQATTANKPTLAVDGVAFDGIDDFVDIANLLSAGGSSARTLFIKARAVTVDAGGIFAINDQQAGTGNARSWNLTPEIAMRVAGFELYDAALSTSNYEIITIRNPTSGDISSLQAWVNGSELGVSGGGGTDGFNVQGTVSAIGRSAINYGNIRYKAIWFYNVQKNNTERAALEAEMALIP